MTPTFQPINVPPAVERALDRGAALVVSVSGGKDSQAMLNVLAALHRERGWRGELVALHADLGRTEWVGNPEIPGFRSAGEHVRYMTDAVGVPLHVVTRTDGRDMIDHWEHRLQQLEGTGKPFWSSAKNRYCTSDMKRGPMDKWSRRYDDVVVCEGLRAQESAARAKKAEWEPRAALNNSVRRALTWRPIFRWSVTDVYQACGTTWWDMRQRQLAWSQGDTSVLADWPMAPAYVLGNERLSCSMCVLAKDSDLINGAKYNVDTFRIMLDMEQRSGFTFKQSRSLAEIGQMAGVA